MKYLTLARIPATWCPNSRAVKPAKSDVTRFALTNMAGNITPPSKRGGKCCIAGGPDKVSRRKSHKKSQVSRGYMG